MSKTKKMLGILLIICGASSLWAEDDSKFALNARIQARALMGQLNTGYASRTDFDTVDFNFRRIRLTAKYTIAPWVGGVVDIKGENMINHAGKGLIQEANVWFKPGFLGMVIKFGQFKIPFLREQLTSSADLLLTERAYSEKILQQMDIGLLIALQPLSAVSDEWAKKLDLFFSVTNGDGSTHDGVGGKAGEMISTAANTKLINWRVQINPFGGPTKDGKEKSWKDGTEIFQGDRVLWSLGAGGAHTLNSEGSAKFLGQATNNKAYNGFTFDTTFFAYGIYVNGEYTTFGGDAVTALYKGGYSTWQGTIGYNLKIGSVYLMPLVRYNYIAQDSNNDGVIATTEQGHSLWLGADLFAIKHEVKFQVFYQLVGDAASSKLKQDVLYFQLQTNFGKKI